MDKPRKTAKIDVRLPEELKLRLLQIAEAEDISLSQYVCKVLKRAVMDSKAGGSD